MIDAIQSGWNVGWQIAEFMVFCAVILVMIFTVAIIIALPFVLLAGASNE